MASVTGQVQGRPEVGTAPQIQIEDPCARTYTAVLRLLLGSRMRARSLEAGGVSGVDVTQHEADAPQLPTPRCKVKGRPLVAVHHVAVSVMSQEDLTDGARSLAALVEDGHEHMEGRVAVGVSLVHIGPAVDKKQDHVRVEVHGGHVQGGPEQAASSIHVDADPHKRGGDVRVLLAHRHQQRRVALAVQGVAPRPALGQGHGYAHVAFEASHMEPRPTLGVDGIWVEGLLRENRQHLNAGHESLSLVLLLLAKAKELHDDALPLRALDDTRERGRCVPKPLQRQLRQVLQRTKGSGQLREVVVVEVQCLELLALSEFLGDLVNVVVAQGEAPQLRHLPDGLR
mmetsp:Transcript_116081/g.259597  ORF Transcript_116081/g.259597 Transcript_116081/m.259597 type:complete len:342 (+) Transcript_116081:864-1889(+)